MIARQVTEYKGEWFTDGTVDDWLAEHAASVRDGSPSPLTSAQARMVRKLATKPDDGRFWLVRTSGGYWHRLLRVGLYDGWPYWRKRLAVGTDGPIPGMHQHEASGIEAIGRGELSDGSVFPFYPWRLVEEVKP